MTLRPGYLVWAGLALLACVSWAADKETKKELGLCPISGGPAVESASVDYRGGKLHFCCPGCISSYKKDPAKYEAKANQQLVVSGQATQVACPLTGKKTNPAVTVKVGGVDVQLCCNGCKGTLAKADEKQQLETVFLKGFDKGFKVTKK